MLTDWRKLHGNAFVDRRVLVTGGGGFIGSHLVETLSTLGANVVVFDDFSTGDRSNLDSIANVAVKQGSVLDPAAIAEAVRGCEFVFHQAALVSVPASIERPRAYHDVNVTGTVNVLDAAKDAGAKRVMFAASSSAYGDSEVLPKVETMPPASKSPYAAGKAAAEQILKAFAASYPLDTVNLRYFNIFGPRQNANSAYAGVIAAFAKTLLEGRRPTITGDGEATRDFTFVHNAVHANLLAARHPTPLAGEIFNVATAKRGTITELALAMAKLLGREDLTPLYAPPRAGDVRHSMADIALIRATLGYEPIVDFQTGLAATVEWYKTKLTR